MVYEGLENPGDDSTMALPVIHQGLLDLESQVSNLASWAKSLICQTTAQPLLEVGLPSGFLQGPASVSYPALDMDLWAQYTALPEEPHGVSPSQVCTAIATH
jgi:hypothetical protein